jgi:hypothetical protein
MSTFRNFNANENDDQIENGQTGCGTQTCRQTGCARQVVVRLAFA